MNDISKDNHKKQNLLKRYNLLNLTYDSIIDHHRGSNITSDIEYYINQTSTIGRKLGVDYEKDMQNA